MLFKNISEEQKTELLNKINPIRKEFLRGEIIFHDTELCNSIAIIRRGVVKASQTFLDGHDTIVRILQQNEIIGLSLIFSSNPFYKASFYAETLTSITLISKDDLFTLMKESNIILQNVLSELSDYAISLHEHIRLLSYKTLREKLCAYFYLESQKKAASTFLISLSKTELAAFLNVERPSLSTELSKLIADGILANQNKVYTILDYNRLLQVL